MVVVGDRGHTDEQNNCCNFAKAIWQRKIDMKNAFPGKNGLDFRGKIKLVPKDLRHVV